MINLTLPYPISSNRYWATRVITPRATGKPMAMTYITPEAKAYKAEVEARVLEAFGRQALPGRLVIEVDLYPHRPQDWERRIRKLGRELWDDSVQCIDLGNAEKVLSDALQGVLIDNDRAFWRIVLERQEPDGLGRVEARIGPFERRRTADVLPLFAAGGGR